MKPVQSSSGSRRPFYLILIGLLFLVNLLLFYNNFKVKKERTQVSEQLNLLEDEKNQLQVEYNETIAELDTLQLYNQELLDEQVDLKADIEAQKAEVSEMFRKGNLTKGELSKARKLIASLQLNTENYRQQIQQLQAANMQLSDENQNLKQEVVVQQATNKELEDAKSLLQDEVSQVSEAKDQLEDKVARSKQIFAENVMAKGVKFKKNNKLVETNNSKKVEQIEVCFDLLPNNSIENPKQEILLRVVNPEGVTLSLGAKGSGTFQLAGTTKELPYSVNKQINYVKQRKNYCVYWEQDAAYMPGVYTAEVYHQGKKIGGSNFELKDKVF